MEANKNQTGMRSLDRIANDPRVKLVFSDEDGYWVWIIGWHCAMTDTGSIHEYTIKDVKAAFRGIYKCPNMPGSPGFDPDFGGCSCWANELTEEEIEKVLVDYENNA